MQGRDIRSSEGEQQGKTLNELVMFDQVPSQVCDNYYAFLWRGKGGGYILWEEKSRVGNRKVSASAHGRDLISFFCETPFQSTSGRG